MKRLLLGLSSVALLLASCAPVEQAAVAPKIAAGTVLPNGRTVADPALWMVKDADTTVYLFGTVHVLRPDVDWFDGPVRTAYDASADLMLEMVEPDPQASAKIVMATATDPDGPPLTQKLTPELRVRYQAAMKTAGLPAAAFDTLEPWFAASALGLIPLGKLGYDAANGAETVLTKAAKASSKPISGLETFEQQLGYFDTLPEPLQIQFLASTIDEMATAETKFAELISTWVRGDADRLAVLMNEGLRATPEIGKLLLGDRNARWAVQIDERMDRPGTTFIAVGAGHLAGADSVQAMLAKRGMKVTRLQ